MIVSFRTIPQKHTHLLWLTAALLLIVISRLLLLNDLSFDQDEVWSVWQSFGTPQEIIARTPFDWPAGYYLSVGFWRGLVGYHPVTLRILSVLLFLLSSALTYRLGRKLYKNHDAGLLVMLAYAALGYVIYLSVLLRAYAAVMLLLPLGLLLVMRYFERPSVWRALHLGVLMAGMFYLTLSSIFAFMVFGGFSLFMYGVRVWRWWLPGLLAFLVGLPEILNKLGIVTRRTAVVYDRNLPPLPTAVYEMFTEYFGVAYLVWLAIVILATGLILLRSKKGLRPLHLWLLIWAILGTCLLYWVNSRTSFFKPRYAWWVALAIALWAGYGLSRLPRIGRMIALGGLALLLFVPQDIAEYKEPIAEFEPAFEWLAEHYRPGDVLVRDPNLAGTNLRAEVWDYYQMVYFPTGLHVVEQPTEEHRRVWYVRFNGHEDQATKDSVLEDRLGAEFYGRPGFLFQLFVAPPDREGILFANGLRFHGVEILDENGDLLTGVPVWREGSSMHLRLWWSVDEPLAAEYSVGVHLFREDQGTLFLQNDGAPQAIVLQPNLRDTVLPPMTEWQPGQYYVEERTLDFPVVYMQRTPFTAYLTVYEWWEGGERIPAPGVNEERLLPLFDFTLMAW